MLQLASHGLLIVLWEWGLSSASTLQSLKCYWWFTIQSRIGSSCCVRTCLKVWSVVTPPPSPPSSSSFFADAREPSGGCFKKKKKKGFALKQMKCASCPTRRPLLWRHACYQFGFWSRLLMLRGWRLTRRFFYFHFFFSIFFRSARPWEPQFAADVTTEFILQRSR